MTTPHLVPAHEGIYVDHPRYLGLRDGDTLCFEVPTLGEIALRLMDIDCPERGEPLSEKATAFSDECCRKGNGVQVYLAFPEDKNKDGRLSLKEWLQGASFDRWIGTVFCGPGSSSDLRRMLVARGLAKWTA